MTDYFSYKCVLSVRLTENLSINIRKRIALKHFGNNVALVKINGYVHPHYKLSTSLEYRGVP